MGLLPMLPPRWTVRAAVRGDEPGCAISPWSGCVSRRFGSTVCSGLVDRRSSVFKEVDRTGPRARFGGGALERFLRSPVGQVEKKWSLVLFCVMK